MNNLERIFILHQIICPFSVLDSEHNAIYDEMMKTLDEIESMEEEEGGNVINVLSLDGGGIRGLVIAQVKIEYMQILPNLIVFIRF
jgi:hypothetical protein